MRRWNRRSMLMTAWVAATGTPWWMSHAAAAEPDASERLLPTTSDLQASLANALARGEPLIVLATLRGCPFCKVARENYLVSELQAGRAVTQIHFLSRDPVKDLQGRATTQGQLVKSLGIEAAPTLLFLGANAAEVAPRLVGGSTSDFYAAYLDERIAKARAAVRG
ncbi:thioredoxin family protein [Diaphorobacter aerolatus]|uniref:Thioredoxin fold domain-containing protein n=1 Tax=Diaphorobacter aerolatus TaxID=1288495 RepID=A0A7H0GJP2_9BURK|nr:hypothetical protein [Diaphorobacter aerolatus]QNP48508.1 hypothetical protein H9K75_21755 [Diaphorobacter aerolatus]